mmetsp:Transcript_60270/g.99585  ORF Transcript_60270/g.99585 Transcript_60270/m.99585 type:complete len:82 (-) Transcript_60270:263-508(-)
MSTAMGGSIERNQKTISWTHDYSLHTSAQEGDRTETFLKEECMFPRMVSANKEYHKYHTQNTYHTQRERMGPKQPKNNREE